MKHSTEEDLIERLYTDDDELAVDPHLKSCAQCARDLAALRSDLDRISFAETP